MQHDQSKRETAHESCPVCGGGKFLLGRLAYDDRYGHPGSFHLAECGNCGHLVTLPRLAEQDLPNLYGTYYPRKSLSPESVAEQASAVRKPFARLRRWWMGTDNQGQYAARSGERVLDIGCGSGASLLEAQALGAEAYGVEADPNVEQLASALGLRIHQGNIGDRPFPELAFDLIILNQVIEHIPEPDKAMMQVAARLVPGGRVVMVFPNRNSIWCRLTGARWINWHIPYHLHHFNLATFERLARRCGFEVVHSRTITPNLWTVLQWRASRHPVPQGQPNPIWLPGLTSKESGQRTGVGPRRLLRRFVVLAVLSLVAILNRAIDFLGFGDSLMVELKRATPV